MPDTTSDADGREGVPAGYREALYWRISDKRWQVIAVNILALLSLAPWLFIFSWLGIKLGRLPQSGEIGLRQFLVVLAGAMLTLVLHELGHALAMRACGAQATFGVLWTRLMVYASAPGHAFARSSYMIVGLAPLVGISLLALPGMILLAGTPWVNLLVLCAAANAAGASGDLWILSNLLRFPRSARVIDERDGMRILLPAL
jgi:hypothetical protein